MSALLTRAAQTLSARSEPTGHPLIDGCAPDCVYEYLCDSSGRYYSRKCCFRSDCTRYCSGWERIGNC
jgi:hypothetical protein